MIYYKSDSILCNIKNQHQSAMKSFILLWDPLKRPKVKLKAGVKVVKDRGKEKDEAIKQKHNKMSRSLHPSTNSALQKQLSQRLERLEEKVGETRVAQEMAQAMNDIEARLINQTTIRCQ